MEQRVMSTTIFVAGRYNKYSRVVSQTPWFVDGNRKVADSVEGFITDAFKRLLPHARAKFIASGREDVDVQMLGRGRPFALEIENPENADPSANLLQRIQVEVARVSGGKVTVKDLQLVKKKDVVENLKDEEREKSKQYRAVCCCSRPIAQEEMERINAKFETTTLRQKTPIRVLHRRPLAVRLRSVMQLQLLPLPSAQNVFALIVVTESGTYIKEFVHGDFGRTRPSLSDIIGDCSADILSLDVEEVFVDWPPALQTPAATTSSPAASVSQGH